MNRAPEPSVGQRGRWDIRVVYVPQRHRWWWSAYHRPAGPDLYGFTDSQQQAWQALAGAIATTENGPAPQPSHSGPVRRRR